MMKHHKNHSESGFLLPIVAIILASLSIFLVNGLNIFDLRTSPERVEQTIKGEDRLQNFLASYAHRNYRIPCPADPDGAGTPTKADDGFERAFDPVTGCAGGVVGLIPWKTLGIPQQFAKDGWGRYFTYAVSPVFTMVNRDIFTAGADPLPKAVYGALDNVHARCRIENVWVFDRDPTPGVNNRNINPFKARFCCPQSIGVTKDIQILGYTAGTVIDQNLLETVIPVVRTTDATLYANFDTPQTLMYDVSESQTGMIYVIVSHGQNGNGSYRGPLFGGAAKNTFTTISAAETENADDDNVFQWSPTVRSIESYATSYYDDIMSFGTQDTLWGRLGGYDQSCARPYTDYAPMEWELGG